MSDAKRAECPSCSKKGLGKPKMSVASSTMVRECRYCRHIVDVGSVSGEKPALVPPETGYFWARFGDSWEPAEWTGKGWWMIAGQRALSPDEVDEFCPLPKPNVTAGFTVPSVKPLKWLRSKLGANGVELSAVSSVGTYHVFAHGKGFAAMRGFVELCGAPYPKTEITAMEVCQADYAAIITSALDI